MSGNHDIIDSTQASSHDTDSTADILHLDLELSLKDLTEDELNLDMALFQNDELSSLSMNPDILDSEPTFIDLGTPTVQMRQNAVVSNVQTVTTLRLHRGNVLNEMIRYYEDTDIDAHIEIKMVYPNGMVEAGEDNGGVLRDALTEFWTTFYETRTIGNTIKVPALMHIMSNAQWIACGRILVMGFKQQGYLPIQLAEPFMNSVLYENYKHTDHVDSLLQSFQRYVPDIEKDLIKVILNDFESADKDELMDFLSAHDVRVLVNKKNVSDVLCQVAHKELIQAPSFVARCWENTIGQELVPFMTETYQEHCKAIIPTTRKVLNMLHFPDELNNDQSTVSRHLKNYIKSLSQDKLQYFLRFVTGSDLIIGKQIQIRFVKLSEFQRRPVAHTCGCVLEIPTNYDTYVEFRS